MGQPGTAEGDEADLVGTTSARLLAAGVPRADRLGALRLLGVLLTVADGGGRVRRPVRQVAREFDLPGEPVGRWLEHLEAAGAVTTTDEGVVVASGEPAPSGAFRLDEFLGIAADLDERRQRRRAVLRPIGAVAAAAAVAALVLVPSFGDGGAEVTTAADREPPAVAPTTEGPPAGAPPGGDGNRDGDGAEEPGGSTAGSEVPAGPGTSAPAAAPGPSVVAGEAACPPGAPHLEVLGTTTLADGRLSVDGAVRNTTAHDVVIEAFWVLADTTGETVRAPGTETPVVVPAGGSVLWQASLPLVGPPGTDVAAELGEWRWRDDALAGACGTP